MACLRCHAETIDQANFCHLCGLMQKPFCVVCKIELPNPSHFCFRCGLSLSAFLTANENAVPHSHFVPPAPPVVAPVKPKASAPSVVELMPEHLKSKFRDAQAAITSERKLVSILFADLSGFTAMSEKMDPEQVTDIMNQTFSRLGKIIYENEGYIDKFMGDCIMALFGAPIAHENDSELAIDCSLKMLEELEKLNIEINQDLGMSIGINSGMVIAGGVGTDKKFDYTVMGDAVNVAQRLQSAAERNQILVSRNIFKVCEAQFEFVTLPPVKVKGKQIPLDVFSVKERRKKEHRDKGLQSGFTQLIGREKEIAMIQEVLNELPKCRAQSLFISGEPGIGKSRVKHELKKMCIGKKYQWFETKCATLQRETPYFAFIELLNSMLGIDPKADLNVQRERFAIIETLSLDAMARNLIAGFLGIPLLNEEPIRLEAKQKQRAIFTAIRSLCEAYAKRSPMALFFEDLSWMDPLSKELLSFLLEHPAETPILIVATHRNDFQNPWKGIDQFHEMFLKPLTPEDCITLVRTILQMQSVPEALTKLIASKSDGNPLYVEEILKSLMDAGKIVKEGHEWRVAVDIDSVEIPATIQGIIASRIDRLKETDKQVLQYASIIGRKFSDALLSKSTGLGPELYEILKFLRKKELIYEVSSDSDEIVYMFNHALMQEVAYQSILNKTQRIYHERVAEALEAMIQVYPENKQSEYYEALAHHFICCENEEKAVHYLLLTGKKLDENFENDGAIKSFSKAIELLEADGTLSPEREKELSDLYFRISQVCTRVGDYEAGEKHQTKNLEIGKRNNDLPHLARSYRRLGEIYRIRGKFEKALEYLHLSLECGVQASDFEGQIITRKNLGNTYKLMNRLDEAFQFFEKGLEGARFLKNSRLEAEYLNDMATVLIDRHQLSEAKLRLEESIEIIKNDRGLRSLLASTTLNLGVVEYFKSDIPAALTKFRETAKIASQIGDMSNLLISKHNIGEMLMDQGQYEEALQEFESSYKTASSIGNDFERINNLILIGYLKTRTANRTAGIQILEDSITECSRLQYWSYYSDAYIYLGRAHSEAGDKERAEECMNIAKAKGQELKNESTVKRAEAELEKLSLAVVEAERAK